MLVLAVGVIGWCRGICKGLGRIGSGVQLPHQYLGGLRFKEIYVGSLQDRVESLLKDRKLSLLIFLFLSWLISSYLAIF